MQSKCFICNKPLRALYGFGVLKFWLELPCFVTVYFPRQQQMGYFGMCMKDALWSKNNITIAETVIWSKVKALEKGNDA